MYDKLQAEQNEFINKITKEVKRIGKKESDIESDALRFVEHIKTYINQEGGVGGFQCVLGYKNLF